MKIDIWSDFACPFCYIGKRHLEKALEEYPEAEVVFHSFELDPHTAVHHEEDIHQLIANKYGISYEQSKANNDQITKMAAEAGLVYDFDRLKTTNTFTAHRLAQYAKEQGKGNEFVEAGMNAYFAEGAFLNDEDTLAAIAIAAGLDEAASRRVFRSQEYLAPVRVDETKAVELGITSVPFFLINEQYAISGAQPVEAFKSVLEQVASDSSPTPKPDASGPTCDDGTCHL